MEWPVLKYLDILIGLAVAVLLVATAVTAIAQVFLASSFARARHLRDGLEELIAGIDPLLLAKHKRYLAQRVQRHPLVSRGPTSIGWLTGRIRNRLLRSVRHLPGVPPDSPASVIQREELIIILLEWASGGGHIAAQDQQLIRESKGDEAFLNTVRADLRQAVANAGISDPTSVASKVGQLTLDQETANPQLSAVQWRAQAILLAVPSDLTSRIFSWFDNTVTRVTDNFAVEARILSCIIALVVCSATQFDSFALLKRLSKDGEYRAAMVESAKDALERYDRLPKPGEANQQTPPNGQASLPARADLDKQSANTELNLAREALQEAQLKPEIDFSMSWGILFSWMLVSLGAPFWYDLLKQLLSLRSLLAQKDDKDRADRQASQQPQDAPPLKPAAQVPVISDQPDLVGIKTATVLRSGKPSASAPAAAEAAVDTLIAVTGAVEGEPMKNSQNQEINKWYRTPDGYFLWAGATDKP